MQVGVHLWHEGPAGGLQYDLKPQPLNTYIPQCAASTTEPSPTPTELLGPINKLTRNLGTAMHPDSCAPAYQNEILTSYSATQK